jgi:hypothetical protein
MITAESDLSRHNVRPNDATAFVEELCQPDACATNPAAKIKYRVLGPQRQVLHYRGKISRANSRRIAAADPIGHSAMTHRGKDFLCTHQSDLMNAAARGGPGK